MALRLLLILFLLSLAPVRAQDEAPTPPVAADLQEGGVISGRIDGRNPRAVYYFEGSRGEVMRFVLRVTDGNLDPVLSIFDNTGAVVQNRDDAAGDLMLNTTLPNDGQYYVVVGRFGYGLGSTSGEFELTMERLGIQSDQGSTLRYGVAVTNRITNTQPQLFYTFRAAAGDILNIEMLRSSGTLDPFVQVVDRNRFLIAENDDAFGGETQNARIENLVIDEAGTYIVIASRYGLAAGESVGSFVLRIDEADNSGLGNSRQAPAPVRYGQVIEAPLSENQAERFYRFEGQQDDVITISMDQIGGRIDAELTLYNAGFQPLISDDDSGGGRNARIAQYRLPVSGIFHIRAARSSDDSSLVNGVFRLQINRERGAFDEIPPDIPRLLYGTSLQDRISDEDPDSLFVFWGTAGDVITINMTRADGNLDPVLELLDGRQQRMLRDDDSGGGGNALIASYTLTYTGVHTIRAMRNGSGTGSYILTLVRLNP